MPAEHDLAARLGDWAHGTGPLNAQLAAAIGRLVEGGVLAPGTLLPPERRLAAALHVSRTTVVAAYDRLKDAGRLVSRQGSGTRVAPTVGGPIGASAVAERANDIFRDLLPDGVIDLSAACPPASPLVEHLLGTIGPDDVAGLTAGHGYQPAGLPALRSALATRLTATGLRTRPEEVLVTNGAQQAIALIAALAVRPGEPVLVEEVTYPGALDAFRAAGARLVPVPMDDGGMRVDQAADLLATTGARLIYTVPTYQNPTGTVLDVERRRWLAKVASDAGVPLVEDTAVAECHLSGPPPPPPVAAFEREHVLTVGSLGKVLWGGLRVGWVRAPERMLTRLTRLRAVADLGGPLVTQTLAARLVPDLDEAVAFRVEALLKSRDRLVADLSALLPEWHYRVPDGGTVLWVRLPRGDARSFAQVALRVGVAVAAGPALSPTGAFADYVRIPFVHDPDTLVEAVRRLAAAWRAYSPGLRDELTSELVFG